MCERGELWGAWQPVSWVLLEHQKAVQGQVMKMPHGSRCLASLASQRAGLLGGLLPAASCPSLSARLSEEAGEGGSKPPLGTEQGPGGEA